MPWLLGCGVDMLVLSKVQYEIKTTCTKKLSTYFEGPLFEELVTQTDRKEGKGEEGVGIELTMSEN